MKNIKYNRIAAVMVEEGIGNAPLAKYLGVSIETISKWRQNKTQPSLQRLYEIAQFFKIDVCKLLIEKKWEPGLSSAELIKIEEEKKKGSTTPTNKSKSKR